MDLVTLEQYLQLMKKYNVESFEMEGVKLTVKVTGPNIEKKTTTLEKLDKLASLPSPEELEMWSTGTKAPNPLEGILKRTKKAE